MRVIAAVAAITIVRYRRWRRLVRISSGWVRGWSYVGLQKSTVDRDVHYSPLLSLTKTDDDDGESLRPTRLRQPPSKPNRSPTFALLVPSAYRKPPRTEHGSSDPG